MGQVRYDVIGDATTIRPNGRHDYSLYFVENGVVYFDKKTKVEKNQVFYTTRLRRSITKCLRRIIFLIIIFILPARI